ncbi:MAG: N-acetylglucosamine-6-phosphate deacetylase [Raoultibacter sp.]
MKIIGGAVFCGDSFEVRDVGVQGDCFAPPLPDDTSLVDAAGCYVIPGLIDIHFHGCVGYDFCDGTSEAFDAIGCHEAARGVTAICPATMTYPEAKLDAIVRAAAAHADAPDAAALVGINMEGPFISEGKIGAQNPAYVQVPDAALFRRLQAAAGGLIKLVDVAPEVEGALAFIDAFHNEVRISVAHTCADYATTTQAFLRGARHVTHLYNAMPPLHHRDPGVIGAAIDAEDVMVEVIADGVHIHPTMVRAAFTLFGDDKVVLISDSMMATGLCDGAYSLGGQAVAVRGKRATLADGTLAGSATDLAECLRVAVADMGIPLASAVRAATINPARALGIEGQRGAIALGHIADAVILNPDLTIKQVVVRGRVLR